MFPSDEAANLVFAKLGFCEKRRNHLSSLFLFHLAFYLPLPPRFHFIFVDLLKSTNMDSLPSLSAILKAEGPVSLASISFPFVEIITTIRSGPQLRALEKLLDLYSEKKAALAQVEEEMLSDWAIYWQSRSSFYYEIVLSHLRSGY